jgi:molybdopterin converting factor small subunit
MQTTKRESGVNSSAHNSQDDVEFRVRLFAAAKQTLQSDCVVVRLPPPLTIERLQVHLATQFPEIAKLVQQSRLAVNAAYVPPDHLIAVTDEIALIPPVSGG